MAVRRSRRLRSRYYAFLSYSHKDKELADWLHCELERFRVPRSLAGRLTANGVIPKRLTPIFRDQHDLSAADDLSEEIESALAASQYLIVLCSPASANSRWTNAEIESFKHTRPEGCVFAVVVAGEPFASDIPGREGEECFPPALRHKYDRRGRPTAKRAEPLAADLREGGEGRRLGFLKLVAGMLGVGLDELVQRETTRRHRQLAWLAAASLAGMAVTSTLAVTAIQARDAARDQRREAEGLIGFMLGDLRDKLEPIGRLDALDGVGSRVLAYYQKQDKAVLSDAALSQRSRALSLMAEVTTARGDSDGAFKLYREAMSGTAEAVRRDPDDPQRLFEHAQNVFYYGQLSNRRGDRASAESAMREYKRLAMRMVSLAPDNMKWRMEVQYADTNLGFVFYSQRRFAEAENQFEQALKMIEAFAAVDPKNADYQKSVSESLAWLADSEMSQGKLAEATVIRERQVALLNRLTSRSDDVDYYERLVPAEFYLGDSYMMLGKNELALKHYRAAVDQGSRLIAVEPDNSLWLEFTYKGELRLADALIAATRRDEAALQTQTACNIIQRLLAKDAQMPIWQSGLRDCWIMRSRLALAANSNGEALQYAERAVVVAKSIKGSDPGADAFALAKGYRLLGEAKHAVNDDAGAAAAWRSAAAALPHNIAERPSEMFERALALRRVGANAEPQQLESRLKAIGYRNPEL